MYSSEKLGAANLIYIAHKSSTNLILHSTKKKIRMSEDTWLLIIKENQHHVNSQQTAQTFTYTFMIYEPESKWIIEQEYKVLYYSLGKRIAILS